MTDLPLKMAERKSSDQKDMKKKGTLEHEEGRKNNRKFSKLCLMVEAQIISLSDVVLKII